MKSKAAVLYEYHAPLAVEEIEVLGPQEGEVLVKIAASGVCRTNWRIIQGDYDWCVPPMVLGDEGAGVVEDVGKGVTRVKPGDHVVLSWIPYCGNCYYCDRGITNLCENPHMMTSSRFRKGNEVLNHLAGLSTFSEYTVAPEEGVIPIRSDAPLDKAALVGCGVPTGWGAVIKAAKVEPGSSVAVIGVGGVGLNVIQGAVLAGAEKIIAVDIKDNKLEMARQFGATHTINANQEDSVERIRELTDGRGADYAFDVIGTPEVIENAYASLRPGGTAVMVGWPSEDTEVKVKVGLLFGERKLVGTSLGSIQPSADIPKIINLYMAGKLKLDELITKRFPLDNVNDAMNAMVNGEVARALIEF